MKNKNFKRPKEHELGNSLFLNSKLSCKCLNCTELRQRAKRIKWSNFRKYFTKKK